MRDILYFDSKHREPVLQRWVVTQNLSRRKFARLDFYAQTRSAINCNRNLGSIVRRDLYRYQKNDEWEGRTLAPGGAKEGSAVGFNARRWAVAWGWECWEYSLSLWAINTLVEAKTQPKAYMAISYYSYLKYKPLGDIGLRCSHMTIPGE